MPTHSTLARLEQAFSLSLLGAALLWLAWHWAASPALAVTGAVAILLGHALVLGLEFIALGVASRFDSTPAPTAWELLRAWLGESTTAPRVFCWHQPFAWRAQPDFLDPATRGRRGAVFVHGFVCNRGLWTHWMARLRERGHGFVAVNLEPVFGSIDEYVTTVDEAVRRVTQATGLPPVLICHSMGGLAVRAWLQAQQAHDRVHHVVTIGSPHQGTALARLAVTDNGHEMKPGGHWLRRLQAAEATQPRPPMTSWYSNCDNIVFPTSTAVLPGADNRLVRGVAHVALVFEPEVIEGALAIVTAPR